MQRGVATSEIPELGRPTVLDDQSATLHGSIATDNDHIEEFHGWVGLAALLGKALGLSRLSLSG